MTSKRNRITSTDEISDGLSSIMVDTGDGGRVNPTPELLVFYDREGKMAERNSLLNDYEKRVPYAPNAARTEVLQQSRLTQYSAILENERWGRQYTTITTALNMKQYLMLQDPYELPTGSYICEDGTYKQGALRNFTRFLKKLFSQSGQYCTALIADDRNVDRVEWKIYRITNGQYYNVKKGVLDGSEFPQKGDVLTLHDKDTGIVYVSEPYVNQSTIFLLYAKFLSLYTVNSAKDFIEPCYVPGFDYALLHRVMFGLPADTPALM